MLNRDCNNKLISSLALLFFSIPTYSASGHVYAGASLGASFGQLGHSSPQISYFSGTTITDNYPLNSQHSSAAILGINGGYEFTEILQHTIIALGIGAYGNLGDYHYKGKLVETASGDPSSTLYDYKYNANSTRLMAEIQLAWMLGRFSPFINLGIGSAWNKMSGYKEAAFNNTSYPPLPAFHSHTNTNFAYQAGFGVSTAFNFTDTKSDILHERISLGYRYVNLGTTSFGTRGAVYPYPLNTGILSTNEIYLGYTHLF